MVKPPCVFPGPEGKLMLSNPLCGIGRSKIIRGLGTTKAVAAELRVSVKTVESYRGKIKDKLGLRSGHELQRQAMRYVGAVSEMGGEDGTG